MKIRAHDFELTYDKGGAQPRSRISRLHRSGNSLGLYIPRKMALQLGITTSDSLRLYIVGRVLCVEPMKPELWTPAVVEAQESD